MDIDDIYVRQYVTIVWLTDLLCVRFGFDRPGGPRSIRHPLAFVSIPQAPLRDLNVGLA